MVNNANILVTGGYGFIGAHMATALADPALGNYVTLMDIQTGPDTSGGQLGLGEHQNVTTAQGSVMQPEDFSALPKDFDYIVHTAAFLGIDNVAEKQTSTLDINIIGTRNCLDFAAEHTTKPHVLYFSTSEIYGTQCAGPAEVEDAVIPSSGARWCYATGKLAGEYYLRAYNQAHGIPGSIVRPFNVFGPHSYRGAISALVMRAVNNQDLIVSGDGRQIRAWCYIDDFNRGTLAMLGYGSDDIEAFNIGDDKNVFPMINLAEKIVEISGSESEIITTGQVTEDVYYRVPDIDKAREVLGYEPTTDFELALEKVIDCARSTQRQRVPDGR